MRGKSVALKISQVPNNLFVQAEQVMMEMVGLYPVDYTGADWDWQVRSVEHEPGILTINFQTPSREWGVQTTLGVQRPLSIFLYYKVTDEQAELTYGQLIDPRGGVYRLEEGQLKPRGRAPLNR